MRLWLGIAVAASALSLAGVVSAADFTDPLGDTYGPDIDKVTITPQGGALHVDVGFANRTELADGELVEINVDLDGNANTGDGGVDLYAVLEGGQSPEVLRFENDDYVDTTLARASFDDAGAHLTVPFSLVGRTVKVTTDAIAAPPPESDPNNPPPPPTKPDTDNAPDTGDYTVAIPRPTLKSATVRYSPAQPRAGKAFKVSSVSVALSSGGSFAARAASCAATLGGRKLAGACSWAIPADAKGKKLRVSVSAVYAGVTFKLPARTFVVR